MKAATRPHHLDWPTMARRIHERIPVPEEPRHRVHVVACYFNPQHWRAPLDNYQRFAGALPPGTPLTVIEASYDGTFEIPGAIHRRATERQILWQKERLLREAIATLPADVEKVAWIDADVLFANKHVLEQTDWLLDRCPVVQLFDAWVRTDAFGRFDHAGIQQGIAHHRINGPQLTTHRWPAPGGAWAARREVAERIFDLAITGSGDAVCWSQWTGDLHRNNDMPPALRRRIRDEAAVIGRIVGGRVGAVPGHAVHLYHGSKENRRYCERRQMPAKTGFDPDRDLELGSNGLWTWTGRNPELEEYCRSIFQFRQEDA